MKKNLIKVTIILSMLLSTLTSMSVNAATSGTYGNLYYTISNNEVTIANCSSSTTVNIPKTIEGYPVTKIGDSAFGACYSITSVTIPNSVTSIGEYAFSDCRSLTSITIPDSVTSIGKQAFSSCNALTSIDISKNIKTIGNRAFGSCSSLKSIALPDGLTSISNDLFSGCSSLTTISIPNSVTSIGEYAFSYCTGLSYIELPNSILDLGKYSFNNCSGLISIKIPDGVTSIDAYAFSGCGSLKKITIGKGINKISYVSAIPDNVTEIIVDADNQYYSSIDGVLLSKDKSTLIYYPRAKSEQHYSIPSSVIALSNSAFMKCKNLISVTINDKISAIPHQAFTYCSNLTSIVLPNNLISIGSRAFESSGLANIEIPITVKSIDDNAFYKCNKLSKITIPENVESIVSSAFAHCDNLASIDVSADNKFYCSDNGIVFSKDKSILECYPYGKTEQYYEIPDTVITINKCAFYENPIITNIKIPNSVTSIKNSAFYNTSALKKVCYNGNEAQWNEISIGTSNTNLTNVTRTYFAYITLLDKDGNIISNKTQNIGETINVSEIEIPCDSTLKLYTDKTLTKEYSFDTPITENLTLYVGIECSVKLGIQEINGIFLVTPTGVENGNRIIFVCYNDDKMVYVNPYIYAGETTIPFSTTETYDKVKVMVWENLETCVPLCEAENVPLN